MNDGSRHIHKARTGLLLATALGGLLITAETALAAGPQPTAPVENPAEAKKLIADAQAALKSGNVRLALINLRNAVRAAPSNHEAHVQLGLVLFTTQDLAGAEREMREALKGGAPETVALPYLLQFMLARLEYKQLLDQFPDPGPSTSPTAPDVLKARASALQRLGRGPEAVEAMDRSLKLRRDGLGLLARGTLAVQLNDIPSARKFADEAIQRSPDNIAIGIFRLATLKLAQDGPAAKAFSDQLLAKYPNNLQIRFAHIEILLDQKQYPAAKTEIDAILAKQPQMLMAKYYRAVLASRTGDTKGAWDVALTLPKEFVEQSSGVGLTVAQIAFDAGRPEVAATTLGRLLRKDAGNLPARRRLASLYLDQGNTNSAFTVLGPVKDTSDPETIRLLARTYNDLDRPADAKKVLARLGAAGERNGTVQHALAELRAGRMEQAIKELKEAAAREPGNPAIVGPLVGALAEARRFPEALAVADRLGRNPGQRGAALIYRGNALLLQRKVAEAKTEFDKAVELEPGNARARLVRANFLIATQKYDAAAQDLRAILAADPKNVDARIKIAQIAALQGEDREARKGLDEVIASSPQDASPRLALIRYLIARKDHQTALRTADDLLRLQPANIEGVALRGQIQSTLGQKREAVDSFRQLVSLTPNDAQSKLILSEALFAAGDRAGAQSAMDEAVKLNPDSAQVKAAQIKLQMGLGNGDAAVAAAWAFQASHPGAQADILLADTLAKAKRFDQASDVLSKSLSAKPDQQVLSKLVEVKLAMNDKKAATNALSQWLGRNPKDLAARQALAMILMGEKDDAGARVQYEAILKLDPANALAMNNLGSLIQVSDPGRAGALFAKAAQRAPNSPDVLDSLGWFKVQQKDAAGGLPLLQRAHDLRPQDGAITYHLAVALDAAAKRDAARALLKSLLASGAKFDELADARRLAANWK